MSDVSGLLKVAINFFEEKGDEWIHLTGKDFPYFMVLKTYQGSDESSGRIFFFFFCYKQVLNFSD